MNEEKLTEYLLNHSSKNAVSFHMPGHKGSRFFKSVGKGELISRLTDFDITEITGADNLFQPEGVLENCMKKYCELYRTKASYMLINGSSAGILAAVLSCINDGDKLILAGNCHKSAISGLTLAKGIPVYVEPEISEEYGISEEILPETIETAIQENPDAKAVLVTSPNYYGICSDINAIAEIVHEAGMILIVDQAHGAHLRFFSETGLTKKLDAESQGADIVINSTHKTLASFTQTAILNVCSDRIDISLLEDMLQLVQSTSPSYIMMASLDINADILMEKGSELVENWITNIFYFKEKAKNIRGLSIVEHSLLDISKVNMDMSELGLSGQELEEKLLEHDIFLELTSGNIAMAMTGIGNTREDWDRLIVALTAISENHVAKSNVEKNYIISSHKTLDSRETTSIPKQRRAVHYSEADGLICASAIIPYPPGVALILPGETINKDVLEYAYRLRKAGQKVLGMSTEGFIYVGI